MEWHDEGVVLTARAHGEVDAIVSIMTFEHGRHVGLVKGGAGRRARPVLQPGSRVSCVWRARLPEHLGHFTVEPVRLYMATMLDDPLRLAAAASACALLEACLPEREPHGDILAALIALLGRIAARHDWPQAYVEFELLVLRALGYAIDLSHCTVTGATEGLAFVSPRTGRAVTAAGAGEYASRLLRLPAFLTGAVEPDAAAVADGLRLAGHFLRRHILEPADRAMPIARDRLVDLWAAQLEEREE